MGILSFLFGKPTNIFNKDGKVEHNLGQDKWVQWNNRLKDNPDYNWRSHKGKGDESAPTTSTKNTSSKDSGQ